MGRINVDINPKVLQWTREEAGYNAEEAAIKLSVDLRLYKSWEKQGEQIPIGKLRKLAVLYKRQLAVFFLPQVPEKVKKPKDFRNLSLTESFLSKEILLTLRRSTHLQRIANDLVGDNYWKNKLEWIEKINSIKKENEKINNLREIIGINIEQQMKWRSDNEAYKKWRMALEDKLGVLVFQFSMPINKLQGFCITENLPYIIITNSNHSYTGRIFTLFHELSHIIKQQSGMCLIDKIEESQKEEWNHNAFAGKFLVPADFLKPIDNLDKITFYAHKLKISREVYLRRLKEEKIISDSNFFILLEKIKASYKINKKSKGFALPEIKSKASRGETFYNIVFDAINSNRINYSDAANALGLRLNRLLNEI